MSEHGMILITCGSAEEGRGIARHLVETGLAAGVQVLPIESIYSWQGEVIEDREVLLMAKTRWEHFDRIESVVVKMHSYQVPPFLAIPIEKAHQPYLDWIDETTSGPADE